MSTGRLASRASARTARPDAEGCLARLINLEKRILSAHSGDVRCAILTAQPGDRPVLSVIPSLAPEFLSDQAAARVSCRTGAGAGSLVASLHAYNGSPLRDPEPDASEESVLALVEELRRAARRLIPCAGLDEEERSEVLSRMRKTDLASALVERAAGGRVVVRSRRCPVLFDPVGVGQVTKTRKGFPGVCSECVEMFLGLDKKYCGGYLSMTDDELKQLVKVEEPPVDEEEVLPAKRGRKPAKRIFGEDFVETPKAKRERVENEDERGADEKENNPVRLNFPRP